MPERVFRQRCRNLCGDHLAIRIQRLKLICGYIVRCLQRLQRLPAGGNSILMHGVQQRNLFLRLKLPFSMSEWVLRQRRWNLREQHPDIHRNHGLKLICGHISRSLQRLQRLPAGGNQILMPGVQQRNFLLPVQLRFFVSERVP